MQELTGLLAQHGLALVFANVLLAQGGIPIPALPILVVAGAFVSQGQIALAPLLLVSVVASLIGDMLWYFAGRRYGYGVLRTLCRVAIEPDNRSAVSVRAFGPNAIPWRCSARVSQNGKRRKPYCVPSTTAAAPTISTLISAPTPPSSARN